MDDFATHFVGFESWEGLSGRLRDGEVLPVRQNDGGECSVRLSTERSKIDSSEYLLVFADPGPASRDNDNPDQTTPTANTFEQIAQNIEQVVWTFDSKLESLLSHSGPVQEIYGCKPEAIENDSQVLLRMIHPDDRPRVESTIDSMIQGDSIDVEYRVNPHKNFSRWAWTQGIPIEDEQGNVVKIVGFTKDITDRKQIESSLGQTQERYRSFFEKAQVGLAEITIDGRWRRVNDRLCEILGYSPNELYERTCSSMTHPEDLDTDQRLGQKLLDGEIEKYTHEKRFFTKSGEPVWVRHTSSVIRDDHGEPEYYLTVVQDINEQREAEQELKRRQQLYRDLVSDVPGIVYRCLADERWTMRFMNEKVESITGYPRDAFLENAERSFTSIIHPDDREAVFREVNECVENGEPFEVEYRILTPDDDVRWLLGRGRAIDTTDDGTPILHGVIVDITERTLAQRKIEESERRYRAVFEQAAVGMAYVGIDGSLLRVNEKFRDLLGYTHEELQEKTFQDITHPDDLDRDLRNVEKLKNGEINQYSMEKRYVRKDGSIFWSQLTVGLVRDDNGEPDHFISIIEDIGERKRTEEELRKSEEKFRELAENIDEVFWLTDADKNEMLYVSPVVEELFGIEPEELYENPDVWLDRIHPDDQNRVRKDLLRRQRQGDYDEEYRMVLPEGSIRWLHDRAFPITDDEGSVQRIAGIAEDVTTEKRIESEQETFFNLSLDLFALADYDGKFLDINPAFEDVLGYSRSELTSHTFLEFVHPEDIEESKRVMGQLEEGEPLTDFKNRYITKNGEIRWLSWRAEPGEDMIYAVARDVTEQREYEQKLQTMIDEKETLLKEIHHRVKNNLQMISSMLDMQMREIDSEYLNEKLQDSVNRIKSMALIHENLYQSENLSKLDFKRYIRELTERTLSVHHHKPADVTLEYDVDSEPLKLNHAIPCGLVLNELISNALEHGFDSEREGVISVTFRNGTDRASLVVRDDGQGFESGFKIDETDTFGMQIVRSLVEYELDGRIETRNNEGAVVEVTFPV